ncbi:glycosyltransferase [Paracoccus jiaweipingae]|uniref:glycosyltransferase n=1 Tax=unclassified Paracoccus (in: a-proteobacteria) TaxID=2688777 RepID=UPI0037AFF99E
MNAFFFVVDERLADIATAQALRIASLWQTQVHIFVERRDPSARIRQAQDAPLIHYHYDRLLPFLPAGLPGSTAWPNIVYLRIFAPFVLSGYRRLIYLDADIHAQRALPAIWDVPLPSGLGAVCDCGVLDCPPPDVRGERADWLADISVRSGRYFNSGVLVIDPQIWTGIDFAARMPAYFATHPTVTRYDQDFLNHVFDGNWVELTPQMNCQAPMMICGLSDCVNPAFLHFSQYEKPWYGLPSGWRSAISRRFTLAFDQALQQAGFDPDAYRRDAGISGFRRLKYGLRRALSRAGLRLSKERRQRHDWHQRRATIAQHLAAGMAQGAFAGGDMAQTGLPAATPIFDGRFIRAEL